MKNAIKFIGTRSLWLCAIAFIAAIVFTMAACSDGGGGGNKPQTEPEPKTEVLNNTSYTWTGGTASYNLIISETGAKAAVTSGNFLLLITDSGTTYPYTGTAKSSGDTITLSSGSDTVIITTNGKNLTVDAVSNTIDGKTISGGTDLAKKDDSTGSSNNPFIGTWKGSDPLGDYSATIELKNLTWNITEISGGNTYTGNGIYIISGGIAYLFQDDGSYDFKVTVSGNKLTATFYSGDTLVFTKQ